MAVAFRIEHRLCAVIVCRLPGTSEKSTMKPNNGGSKQQSTALTGYLLSPLVPSMEVAVTGVGADRSFGLPIAGAQGSPEGVAVWYLCITTSSSVLSQR